MKRLSELKVGDKGFVVDIKDKILEQQLLEMGITPGQMIEIERASPFLDPIAVAVSSLLLSVRLSDARNIIINPINE